MKRAAIAVALAVSACGGVRSADGSNETTSPAKIGMEDKGMSAVTSPAGEAHPGQIEHVDKATNRRWTRAAADVPETVGWVQVDDGWQAVVRIELVGNEQRREITQFGADGSMLETSVASAPPPPRQEPEPEPVPEPVPVPEP